MSGPAPIQTTTQQPGGSSNQNTDPKSAASPGVGSQAPAANAGTAHTEKKFDAEKFASAARREKASRDLENRAKSEWQKSEAAINEAKSYQAEKLEFKKDPFAFMEKHFGMTYEQLTELQLNGGKPTETMSLRVEMEEFKAQQAKKAEEDRTAAEKRQAEEQEAEANRQIAEFKKGIPEKLKSIAKLDMINLLEPEEQGEEIFKIIESHWADEEEKFAKDPNYQQTMLGVEEAADILEEILTEQFIAKASRTKKWGETIKGANKPPTPPGEKTNQESGFSQTRTLTNDNGVGSSPSLLPPTTEAERMKRALSALGS